MQRVVNNIFVIFVSEAHFCKAVVRHLAGRWISGQRRALGLHKRTALGD